MGGFGYITAVIVAAVACGCAYYVYNVMAQKPNVSPQELAPLVITIVTTGVGFVVALLHAIAYYVYYRDELKLWRDERRKQAGPQLHGLLARIKKERRNFEELRDKKPPFSEYTEITPFQLLEKDLKSISDMWSYRRFARKLLAEIARIQAMPRGQKNVVEFMPLLDRLEGKLEADVRGYPSK